MSRQDRHLLFLFFSLLLLAAACAKRVPVSYNRVISDLSEQYTAKADKLAGEAQFVNSNFFLMKAIPLYKNSGDWLKMVECYIKLGNNYKDLDDYKSALQNLDTALNLTLNRAGYKSLELAKSYIKLAYEFFHQKKNYNKALELYRKALNIEKEILGENHREVAKIYNSISLVYWNKGDSKNAVNYYNKSFSIKLRHLMEQGDTIAQDYKFIERETVTAGTYDEAKKSFKESLALHLDAYGQNHPLIASIHEHIGILQAYEGDYNKALEHLGISLAIRLDIFGQENVKSASSYHNIGVCLRLQGEYEQALGYLDNALAIKLRLLGKYHSDTADTYYQLGNVHSQLNRFDEALTYFQRAIISMTPGFSNPDVYANPAAIVPYANDKLFKVMAAKAQALRMRYLLEPVRINDLRSSLDTYLSVCRLIDQMRCGYKSESYKLSFGGKCIEIYGQALQTAFKLYEISGNPEYKEKAFLFSEKSKAALLAEAVSESQARKFAGIPGYLLEKEKKLKDELVLYDTYLARENIKENPSDITGIKSIEDHYFMLRDRYQDMIDYLEKNYPKYFELKYKSRPISVAGLQQALDRDTALIEYSLYDGVLYSFVLTQTNLEAAAVYAGTDFTGKLDRFYNAIKKIEEKTFLELSHELYEALIKPIRHYLIDKKRLIIIPCGRLYYIPFEALSPGADRESDFSWIDYLIKHYYFNYHYSARLWLYNTQHEQNEREKNFIGFAPVFSDAGELQAQEISAGRRQEKPARDIILAGEGTRYPALPASEKELRSIIKLFLEANEKAVGYFQRQATEEIFKSADMRNFTFIHIATHSLKTGGDTKLSGLIFTRPSRSSAKEDGILYSSEIYNLSLDAQLVVLSSCESGVGELVDSEGMIALARGFFYAGVRNIIFSLWQVEDKTTSQLMIELYRNILAGEKLPYALQKAKLSLIKDKFTAFPRYWSSFILIGE